MAKTIAKLFGVVFVLVGLLGFATPHLLEFHLTPAHNVIHLVTGALSLYFGLKGTLSGAKMFCLIFGAVYTLLGIGGFLLGSPNGEHGVYWRVIPDVLELGTVDHIYHLIVGPIYLIAGLMSRTRGESGVMN